MRIFYVIGSLEIGGAEQHLLRVAKALKTKGFEPSVFSLTKGGPLTVAFEECGIPVYGVRLAPWLARLLQHPRAVAWTGLFSSAFVLWWLYWRRRPQVVHYFLPAAYIVGGMVALFGPPTTQIMSRRSLNHYQSKHRLFARLEHWLHPRMNIVCGNSRAVVKELSDEGVPAHRLRLIHNGIDLDSFRAAKTRDQVREELEIPKNALVFVMVANLIPYKGHHDLINALSSIKDRLPPDWVCLCVGRDDGIGASLKEQATAEGLEGRVRLLGSRQDVPDILAAGDIGVLSSHEEGFSNAVLEGMAAGLPMVVTNVGGNSEAVVHGETGLVVAPRSPSALGQAMLALASDPDRSLWGQRGRLRVENTFTLEACLKGYVELYSGDASSS